MDSRRRLLHAESDAIFGIERHRDGRHPAYDQFHRNRSKHADAHANGYSNANMHAKADGHTHAYTHIYADSDANSRSNPNSNADAWNVVNQRQL